MTLSEFDLIDSFFADCGAVRSDVVCGVGDDAALLQPPPGHELAITQDTLVEGVHFLAGTDPRNLGHKVLAVNLSDLAAMGAQPAWATLSLTLAAADRDWLKAFANGFCTLAAQHGVRLVGGDTTRGPLSISVCAHGLVPAGEALRRSGARPGDGIWVTGTLGDAGLALRELLEDPAGEVSEFLRRRLERPQPRVAAGLALRGKASAAIDVSDGLVADLGHLTRASGVGAQIRLPQLPLSAAVAGYVSGTGDWGLPLSAGDDYELCFTLPAGSQPDCPAVCIGEITEASGVRVVGANGDEYVPAHNGYRHF